MADFRTVEYLGVKAVDVENRLSLDHDTYEGIVQDSLDPYLFMRGAYAQRRKAQVGKESYNMNIFEGPVFDSDLLNPFEWFWVWTDEKTTFELVIGVDLFRDCFCFAGSAAGSRQDGRFCP